MIDKVIDWLIPETYRTVVCRPALPKDTDDVLELTRTIWSGEDYVPQVWQSWLEDTEGLLAVAEYGPRVVGLGKLTYMGQDEWWLEGLRTHPELEGKGIASRLHKYLLDHWIRNGNGVLRLATGSFREPVHHLCRKTGFEKIGEFTPFAAGSLMDEADQFSLVDVETIEEVEKWIQDGEWSDYTRGLMDLGWQWAEISGQRLAETARKAELWWWGSVLQQGVLAARVDEEEEALVVQLIACLERDLVACLLDFRRLAAEKGVRRAAWLAPLEQGLESKLEAAGYKRDWDASVYIYEKHHPNN